MLILWNFNGVCLGYDDIASRCIDETGTITNVPPKSCNIHQAGLDVAFWGFPELNDGKFGTTKVHVRILRDGTFHTDELKLAMSSFKALSGLESKVELQIN